MSNLHAEWRGKRCRKSGYRLPRVVSLTVLWPPFHLCKFADIAFGARPSPSPTTGRRGEGAKTEVINFRGNTFSSSLTFPFRCGAIRLAHACLSLPTYLSVVCLSMQGISDFNLPSLPPCGFGLARWMTRFGPRAVHCRQPPFLPLFSSPSLSRDTRFIESTGGGMTQTDE